MPANRWRAWRSPCATASACASCSPPSTSTRPRWKRPASPPAPGSACTRRTGCWPSRQPSTAGGAADVQPAPVRPSVIVPVGRGDQDWRSLLPCLATLGGACELLAVAADDQVGPQAADALPPLRWLAAPAGRANQQNAGAAAARGALLWFLHCDSRPDARALQAAASLPASFDALGWFRLGFHDGGPLLALNALGANLRSRAGLPFGDQ